jgi:hypothetical protein
MEIFTLGGFADKSKQSNDWPTCGTGARIEQTIHGLNLDAPLLRKHPGPVH